MRINKFVALATGMSRRAADTAIQSNQVTVNDQKAKIGQQINFSDKVALHGKLLDISLLSNTQCTTIILNKPIGYVVSRNGQGSRTIYDLLPPEYHVLKPVGRLDKDSSGLLLLTNDGQLAHSLAHPSKQKIKVYEAVLDKPLQPLHHQMISDYGVRLEDGPSKLQLDRLKDGDDVWWRVIMHEGRNRQIRRTFSALGYTVAQLHRIQFGQYLLGEIKNGHYSQQ